MELDAPNRLVFALRSAGRDVHGRFCGKHVDEGFEYQRFRIFAVQGGVAGQLVDAYGRASGGPDQSGHVGAFVHESDEPCLRLQWAKVATLVVGRRGWCGEYQWQVMQLPAVAVLGFLIVVDGCRWIEFRREAFDPSGLVAFEPFGNGDVIVKGFLVGHAVRPPLVALVG